MIDGNNNLAKKVLAAQQASQQKEYWLTKLTTITERTIFPYDYPQPKGGEPTMEVLSHRFPADVVTGLAKLSTQSEPKLHVILVAALNALVYKYTQRTDLVTATPIYKQTSEGAYTHTVLPIRLLVQPDWAWKELLLHTRQVIIEATQNQQYPVARLLDQLEQAGEPEAFPLFEIAVLLDTIQDQAYLQPFLPRYALVFCFSKTDEELVVDIHYDTSRYAPDSMQRMASRLEQVLHQVVTESHTPLADLSIVSTAEKKTLLYHFNTTQADYPREKTLVALFEEQVLRTSDQLAVLHQGNALTYHELNAKANQLAHYLRQHYALRANQVVGILVERSPWVLIGILGILKAGAAYVPIDSAYPPSRIHYMLEDTQASVLITDQPWDVSWGATPGEVVTLSADWEKIAVAPVTNLPPSSGPQDLAYVLYTSGSTGMPKGVEIRHASLVNFCESIRQYPGISPTERVLALSTYTFDISILELFVPLLTGGQVFLLSQEEKSDPALLAERIGAVKPTLMQATPSTWKMLLKSGWAGDQQLKAFCGGERLSKELAQHLLGKVKSLWNLYGPTETTIWSTVKRVEDAAALTIGRPIHNTQIYILDNRLQLVPIGLPGEIHISGAGVAKGYHNRPAITQEKFIAHPFLAGDRLYKTGDIGRWLPNGEIECLGRIDHQVKIRGHRIELGEIEQALLAYPAVQEVVVMARNQPDDPFLCAYLVASRPVKALALRDYVLKKLPAYMVPACFVQIEQIKLTPSGKVDFNALPKPKWHSIRAYQEPANQTEQKLVEIWASVLEIAPDELGVSADFFELGGHSVKAAVMISAIHKALGVKLSLAAFFKHSTIRKLAQLIAHSDKSQYTPIEPIETKPYYPVSSGQKRMYIISQLEENITYNFPLVLRMEGRLDKTALEASFRQLLQRHEALRTSFEIREGELIQRIHPEVPFSTQVWQTSANRLDALLAAFFRPFQLDQAPIFRVGLLELSECEHILLVDLHHIVADGVSLTVLMNDLSRLYAGESLPELQVQFKEYVAWQKQQWVLAQKQREEQYWLRQFQDSVPVLQLPTDYPRPPVQSFAGAILLFDIEKTSTAGLMALALQEEATLFMVLLTAYNTLLYSYTDQEDVVVGTPVVGRPHPDLQKVVGMFANTLALRNRPAGEKTFTQLLAEVKENTLNALENESYPFEELVEKLNVKRDPSRNPLFDTMLSLQNADRGAIRMGELVLSSYPIEQKTAIFDLTVEMEEVADQLRVCLQYCTHLFKQSSMLLFKQNFIRLLEIVRADPSITLADVKKQLTPFLPRTLVLNRS